jgi:biopolymer transport protein ExbD
MAFDVDGDDDVVAQINIVPFVDIVLVLLIVFMLTSTAIARATLEVELPAASSAQPGANPELTVALRKDGSMTIDGAPAAPASLGDRARALSRANANARLMLSADTGVDYGRVIAVLDTARQNGLQAIALQVTPDRNP